MRQVSRARTRALARALCRGELHRYSQRGVQNAMNETMSKEFKALLLAVKLLDNHLGVLVSLFTRLQRDPVASCRVLWRLIFTHR